VSGLTEREILDRHAQALGDADQACQRLGKNADPTYLAPRGHDYGNLKRALKALEGSARQMAHFRADTRWVKLGIVYARAQTQCQHKFAGQRWAYFNALRALFAMGHRRLEALRDNKTGARGPILPTQPTSWLILPDYRAPQAPPWRGAVH
jgi:hypothetical protein